MPEASVWTLHQELQLVGIPTIIEKEFFDARVCVELFKAASVSQCVTVLASDRI